MRIIGVALGCSLLAGAAACGVGGGAYGGPDARADLARARKALAQTGDLGLDFTDRAETGWQPPFRPADQDCRRLFELAEGDALPPAEPGGSAPSGTPVTATASFLGGRLGETAGVVVAAYPPNDARRAMRAVADLMRHCAVASAKAPGGGDRLVASALPVGDLGDGAEARRFKGRVSGYPYEMHLVVVHSGSMLVSLVHAGLAKPDLEKTARLAGVLASNVRQAAE